MKVLWLHKFFGCIYSAQSGFHKTMYYRRLVSSIFLRIELPACTNKLKKTSVTAKMAVVQTSENHFGLSIVLWFYGYTNR